MTVKSKCTLIPPHAAAFSRPAVTGLRTCRGPLSRKTRVRGRANGAAAGQTRSGVKSCWPCTGNGGSRTASTGGGLTTRPRKAGMIRRSARRRLRLNGRGRPLQVRHSAYPLAGKTTILPPAQCPGFSSLRLMSTLLATESPPVFPRMAPPVPLCQSAPVFPGATHSDLLSKVPPIFPGGILSSSEGGLPHDNLTTPYIQSRSIGFGRSRP